MVQGTGLHVSNEAHGSLLFVGERGEGFRLAVKKQQQHFSPFFSAPIHKVLSKIVCQWRKILRGKKDKIIRYNMYFSPIKNSKISFFSTDKKRIGFAVKS